MRKTRLGRTVPLVSREVDAMMRNISADPRGYSDVESETEDPPELPLGKSVMELRAAGKTPPTPEEELLAILNSTKDGIVLVDADHRVLRIKKRMAESTASSEQEVRGSPLDGLISPQNLPRVLSLIEASLGGITTVATELSDGADSGGEPPVADQIATLRRDDQIMGASIIGRSSENSRTRAEVRQLNEERFRNIIENTSDWVWEVNAKCVYTYVNPRVKEILGYEPQQVLGKTIFDLLPLKEASYLSKKFNTAVAAGKPLKLVQISCQHKDGRPVTLETSAVPVFDGEGNVSGYHGIHRDITGREHSEQQLAQNAVNLQKMMDGAVEALTQAVEARDKYAVGHQQRVAKLAYSLVWEMGHSPELGHAVRMAALLHDVGKIFIPVEMLTKPGQLTQDEFAAIKNHPRAGYEILKNIEFPWPVADTVLQHHERMDGSGYPAGLKGDEIRLEARILGVADVVEAMFHPRAYRPALGMEKALRTIASGRGVLYDRNVVEACLSVFLDRGFKFQADQGPIL